MERRAKPIRDYLSFFSPFRMVRKRECAKAWMEGVEGRSKQGASACGGAFSHATLGALRSERERDARVGGKR
ncbi:hypothetical protein TNCV_4276091 [Trichonephila clavipes]|nr:hypothetical protein TNCV_4276091 [Trichonephila clavipes]